jgi:CheY-like chemotaxis protein
MAAMGESPSSSRRKIFPSYAKNQQPAKYYTPPVSRQESKETTSPIQNAELFLKGLWCSIVTLVQKASSPATTALTEEKKCVRSESVSTESSDSIDQSFSPPRQEKEKETFRLTAILPFATSSPEPPKSLPLQSILRETRKYTPTKVVAVSDSGVPSLVEESDDDESSQWTRSEQEAGGDPHPPSMTSSPTTGSEPNQGLPTQRTNRITFDPRVWIREFHRSRQESECTWYTSEDMEEFVGKKLALERIRRYSCSNPCHKPILATGTGRTVLPKRRWNGPIYCHAALALDDTSEAYMKKRILEQELSRILILDPHDLSRQLLAKTIRRALPKKASIATASSSQEVWKLLEEGKRFDMIIVEERLHLFRSTAVKMTTPGPLVMNSGSAVLQQLSRCPQSSRSLLIGLSAHLLEDEAQLRGSGADLCWSKPPPPMDEALVEDLVKALLLKRNQAALVGDLYT